MNYFKLSFFLFFINNISLQAQEYKPLLGHSNEWHFTTCFFGCLTDIYYAKTDTVVNGKPHKILDGYHYISRSFLLHEDVPEQKVYMTKVNETSIEEYLLYDFTLQTGDSIDMVNPITPFPQQAGYFTVDSIRLKTLEDGEDYRHFYFSPSTSNTISNNNCIWIEGVGSMSLINAPSGEPDLNGVGALSCFFKNGQSIYMNLDSIDACMPTLSSNEEISNASSLVLVQKENRIEIFHTDAIARLQLFEINGKRISSFLNTSRRDQVTFETHTLSKGIYVILAEGLSGEKSLLKFVK